jgi:hypothetical protein
MMKQGGKTNAAGRRTHGWLLKRPSDGVIEARSPEGRLLGHYNPRSNETRDVRGDLIGRGNRLGAVILGAEKGGTRW